MRTLISVLLVFIVAQSSSAREAYRYIDPTSGVEYSDMPRPGAERITVPEPATAPALQVPISPAKVRSDIPSGTAQPYLSLRIGDPADEETVRDNGGNVLVTVELRPALQTEFGHRLQLFLDGNAFADPGTATHFALTEQSRGTHTLQAIVLGIDGATLATSDTAQFYLHRTSRKHKKRLTKVPKTK